MDVFTIKAIDTATGNVTVSFDTIDGRDQVIAGLPTSDAAALGEALIEYGVAYAAGLATVAVPTVDPAATAIINKPQAYIPPPPPDPTPVVDPTPVAVDPVVAEPPVTDTPVTDTPST